MSARFHPYLCGRNAAEWLIDMALQEKKIMPPPWLAHREIERYSIGWRMGYGEDYIDRFDDWSTAWQK